MVETAIAVWVLTLVFGLGAGYGAATEHSAPSAQSTVEQSK